MALPADKDRVRALLKETMLLLCKSSLPFKSMFSIEALVGITIDQSDVFLLHVNELVRADGEETPVINEDVDALTVGARDPGDAGEVQWSCEAGVPGLMSQDATIDYNEEKPAHLINNANCYSENQVHEVHQGGKGLHLEKPNVSVSPGPLVPMPLVDWNCSYQPNDPAVLKFEDEQGCTPPVGQLNALPYLTNCERPSIDPMQRAAASSSIHRVEIPYRSRGSYSFASKRGFHNSRRFRSGDWSRRTTSNVHLSTEQLRHENNIITDQSHRRHDLSVDQSQYGNNLIFDQLCHGSNLRTDQTRRRSNFNTDQSRHGSNSSTNHSRHESNLNIDQSPRRCNSSTGQSRHGSNSSTDQSHHKIHTSISNKNNGNVSSAYKTENATWKGRSDTLAGDLSLEMKQEPIDVEKMCDTEYSQSTAEEERRYFHARDETESTHRAVPHSSFGEHLSLRQILEGDSFSNNPSRAGSSSEDQLNAGIGVDQTGPRMYTCLYCGKRSNCRRELQGHMATKHNLAKLHTCSLCGKEFSYKRGLFQHCRKYHGISVQSRRSSYSSGHNDDVH